jgi:signal transduction histidine kinase/ActR/RegA family two-component response regulator
MPIGNADVAHAARRDLPLRTERGSTYFPCPQGGVKLQLPALLLCAFAVRKPSFGAEGMQRDLGEILTPESAQLAQDAVQKALESPNDVPRPLMLELEFNRKDGSTVWLEVNVTLVLAEDGTPVRWVGVSRDITARRQFEAQLASARRIAEAADRSKSEFLANMSHEIRTPLTAILGFADLLREECDSGRLSTTGADAVATIASNGQHLLDLINDILDLSKIEAGRTEFERNPCSPYQVIADVTALMNVRAQAKGLELKTEFDGPIPETVCTDAARLRQILVNLVGNAIKFTESGTVRIIASLHRDDGSPCLRIDVSDTGCGVAEDDESRLFLPFTQADSSTSRRFGGTGLGLAISRKLARLLGGDITLCSRLEQGSTFRLTLETGPIDGVALRDYRTKAPTPQSPESPRKTHGNIRLEGRVLLVEDGPDNQRLISRILERAGGQVAIADNGRKACEVALAALAEGTPYDLLLMDMQMPIMDGYQATRALREAGYRGPIIALTANAMVGDELKCLEAGCNAYLTKPIHHDTFLPCIAAHLTVDSQTAV